MVQGLHMSEFRERDWRDDLGALKIVSANFERHTYNNTEDLRTFTYYTSYLLTSPQPHPNQILLYTDTEVAELKLLQLQLITTSYSIVRWWFLLDPPFDSLLHNVHEPIFRSCQMSTCLLINADHWIFKFSVTKTPTADLTQLTFCHFLGSFRMKLAGFTINLQIVGHPG